MEKCQNIYEKITDGTPHKSLTVHLQYNTLPESWTSENLGGLIPYFKTAEEKLANLEFKKIEFKTEGSDEVQVLDVKTHKFDNVQLMQVNLLAKAIAPVAKAIFSKVEQFIKDVRAPLPSKAELNNQKLKEVKKLLQVQEAGSKENRCATLSIATILLKQNNDDLEAVARKYSISLLPKDGESKQMTLSNGLIELAAKTIETNEAFLQDGYFANVIAALTDAKQTIVNEKNRQMLSNNMQNSSA